LNLSDNILAKIKLCGKDNPIHSAVLGTMFNLKGDDVRDIVRDLRREGYPIASGKSGYFYARSLSELKDTIEDLEGRSNSMYKTANALKQIFKEPEQTLFG